MRTAFLVILMLTVAICRGKQTYTLSRADLVAQFTDTNLLKGVYAYNSSGERVWLQNIENKNLTLKLDKNETVGLMLRTVTFKDGKIGGAEFGISLLSKQHRDFKVEDIQSLLVYYDKTVYTVSKSELNQFGSVTKKLERIYCFNEKGDKVWLTDLSSIQLTLRPDGENRKSLLLGTVRYMNDTLEGVQYSVWQTKEIHRYDITGVQHFIIETKGGPNLFPLGQERHYYSLDSCRKVTKEKNDSLKTAYTSGTEWVVKLTAPGKRGSDTFTIVSNACYSMEFKDGKSTFDGVVLQITEDSICISNYFDERVAEAEHKEYMIYRYPISDIAQINLIKNGISTKKVQVEEHNLFMDKIQRAKAGPPCWYTFYPQNGEIMFCRALLIDGGFTGVGDQNGKVVWYNR